MYVQPNLLLLQISRVLKSNGVYIVVSYGQPDTRLGYIENSAYSWKVRTVIGLVLLLLLYTQHTNSFMDSSIHSLSVSLSDDRFGRACMGLGILKHIFTILYIFMIIFTQSHIGHYFKKSLS